MLIELNNRAAIKKMVTSFYNNIREDAVLNPIFNNHLFNDELWEHHFEKLTDFWESILHHKNSYDGQPGPIHLWVDMQANYKIKQPHFDRWLDLWRANIKNNFYGESADRAIIVAESLAKNFHSKMQMAKAR